MIAEMLQVSGCLYSTTVSFPLGGCLPGLLDSSIYAGVLWCVSLAMCVQVNTNTKQV